MISSEAEKAIELINCILEEQGGRQLKPVEILIVYSAWDELTYPEVLEGTTYSLSYVGGPASTRFWKYLSELFGEKIVKDNLKAYFQRKFSASQQSDESTVQMKVHGYRLNDPKVFCGRSKELKVLRDKLREARYIHVYGLGGIGKTCLITQLVKSLQADSEAHFDKCIWKSIYYGSDETTEEVLLDILRSAGIRTLPADHADEHRLFSCLQESLRESSTLMVLDGIDAAPKWEEQYAPLLRRVCDLDHEGKLITIGRSPLKLIRKLKGLQYPVFDMKVEGLTVADSIKMLGLCGISASANSKWRDLISSYEGNPQIILASAQNVDELHGGSISNFFNFKTNFANSTLHEMYDRFFEDTNRVNPVDKKVLAYILEQTEPINVSELVEQLRLAHTDVSYADVAAALSFLEGCSILKSSSELGKEASFQTSPRFKSYVTQHQINVA